MNKIRGKPVASLSLSRTELGIFELKVALVNYCSFPSDVIPFFHGFTGSDIFQTLYWKLCIHRLSPNLCNCLMSQLMKNSFSLHFLNCLSTQNVLQELSYAFENSSAIFVTISKWCCLFSQKFTIFACNCFTEF